MKSFHDQIEDKIVTLQQLEHELAEIRKAQPSTVVVFTNGCFDLLHQGHVDYLSRARDLGDLLIVGVNSDASVKRLKGPSRPVSHQSSRTHVLAALSAIDYVVVFDDDTPIHLIEHIKPNILVKGGDYKHDEVVGADFVEAHGGRVVLLSLVPGESTTNLINRINTPC